MESAGDVALASPKDSSNDQVDVLSGYGYVERPGFGTAGRPLEVQANMFQASFNTTDGRGDIIYHYNVDIQPIVRVANQRLSPNLAAAVWKQLRLDAKGPERSGLEAGAFDLVKNLWTPIRVCPRDETFEVVLVLSQEGQAPTERQRFKVVVSFASKVDLDLVLDFCKGDNQSEARTEGMLTALQAMNVLLRQDPSDRYHPGGEKGRRFFSLEGAMPIADGGVVLNGFTQSFRFTQSGLPAVQLDTAYSAFINPGLLPDVAASLLRLSSPGGRGRGGFGRGGGGRTSSGAASLQQLGRDQVRTLNRILKGAKFQVTHRNSTRIYSILKVSDEPAEDIQFLLDGRNREPDQSVRLIDYFREQYNIQIRKPRLPCVQYGPRQYIPMELVKIVDFNSLGIGALSSEQTADIIKVAAKPPPQRASMILKWRNTLAYERKPKLQEWALKVQREMMRVPARILNPPEVLYRSGQVRPNNGGWNLRGGSQQFIIPGQPLKSWGVVSFDRSCSSEDLSRGFIPQLIQNLRANGLTVEDTNPPISQTNPDIPELGEAGRSRNVLNGIRTCLNAVSQQSKMRPQLIIVVESAKISALKAEIKRVAADGFPHQPPIVTQVLLGSKINKRQGLDQYINNVTMKVNLKLGGANHAVQSDGLDKRTMLIGADVSHPPAGGRGDRGAALPPSIAVTVAGTSGDNTIFKPAIRLQQGRVEIIQDLENMMIRHLEVFEQNAKSKPEKILMYRDGVSEGQYAHCADLEFQAIKAACKKLDSNYNPKITFVICAKRHHMRFFALNGNGADRTGNLPPGLVVDRQVTHPFAFDFYLQAHAGLQGTARPTHYVVIKDEIGYAADTLQRLTNDLCYTFSRATRSVGLVPPAYYADIIAGAARDLVYIDDSQSTVSGSSQDFDPLRFKKRFEDEPSFGNVAWYM